MSLHAPDHRSVRSFLQLGKVENRQGASDNPQGDGSRNRLTTRLTCTGVSPIASAMCCWRSGKGITLSRITFRARRCARINAGADGRCVPLRSPDPSDVRCFGQPFAEVDDAGTGDPPIEVGVGAHTLREFRCDESAQLTSVSALTEKGSDFSNTGGRRNVSPGSRISGFAGGRRKAGSSGKPNPRKERRRRHTADSGRRSARRRRAVNECCQFG